MYLYPRWLSNRLLHTNTQRRDLCLPLKELLNPLAGSWMVGYRLKGLRKARPTSLMQINSQQRCEVHSVPQILNPD